MLNRRYLRVKVLQALYIFFINGGRDIKEVEKEMFQSIDRIYDLYLYMLCLIVEIRDMANSRIKESLKKKLPTEEDLNPNTKFVDNLVIAQIAQNLPFQKIIEEKKINWQEEQELVSKIFKHVRETALYKSYMRNPVSEYSTDKQFIGQLFMQHIAEFELLHDTLEEKSIYWLDDLTLVCINVAKTLQSFRQNNSNKLSMLFSLYKNETDDRKFVKELLTKTVENNKEYEALIAEKTKNWELDRIAVVDVILMKMTLCEFEHFNTIPVKVSLNEYIELSKSYSTPKSKIFINGVLDKLAADMKHSGKIAKTGRGLIE